MYLVFSILGNYNYFFFAAHLLDVAVGVAALRIILEAITHNGKQVIIKLPLDLFNTSIFCLDQTFKRLDVLSPRVSLGGTRVYLDAIY